MKRREFIKALAGVGLVASATVVRAQQSVMPLVGFLSSRSPVRQVLLRLFAKGYVKRGLLRDRSRVPLG
jgi:hypothetical protein